MTVAGGEIHVPLLGLALVLDMLVFYHERKAQATRSARKGAGAVIGQTQYFHHTPITGPGEIDHGLP